MASLATRDGRLNWLAVYPRAKPRENVNLNDKPAHYYRDLNPAVYHQGKLFVAPADCRSVFALDANSGQLLWQSEHPEDIVHLLGVGAGALVASGDKLWLFNVESGKPIRPPEDGVQGAFGRGLLAGDRVYWPTHEQIHVFEQRTGLRARQPIELKNVRQAGGGNLIVAEGYLVIAGADTLYAFPLSDASAAPEAERPAAAETESSVKVNAAR